LSFLSGAFYTIEIQKRRIQMNEALIPLEAGANRQTPNLIIVHAMAEIIDTEPIDYPAVDWLRKLGLSAPG
jgi:hypothetical protein